MQIPLFVWVFQTIPEGLAMASLILALAGQKLEVKKVLMIGLSYAVAVYGVRLLPVSFGVHTIIIIVVLAALMNLVVKVRLNTSLLYSLVAMVMLAVGETVFVGGIISMTGMSFEQYLANNYLKTIVSFPHIIVIFLLALAVGRWRQKHPPKDKGKIL